jgi:hypothetical protein
MADVFLSYAREDAARAEQLAHGLEQAGVSVFWDNEIPPGQTWADYIEGKLTQSKALIVLWSEHSTKSQWVREEARMGRDKGVLIPVMIDNSQPPFGFGEVQAANLANWNGEADNPNWRRFVDAVKTFASGGPSPATQPVMATPPRAAPPPRAPASADGGGRKGVPVWVWVGGAVVATIVVLGVIGAMLPDEQAQVAGAGPQTAQPVVTQPPATGGVNYQQQVLDRLAQVQQAFAGQGFQQIGQPFAGQLPQGQYLNLPQITLEVGGDYRIVGVCDNDCGDLDLFLYDQNNVLVSQDNLTDAMPIVSVAPQWTGPFTVQAVMHNCTVAPCYYAVVLYGRRVQ